MPLTPWERHLPDLEFREISRGRIEGHVVTAGADLDPALGEDATAEKVEGSVSGALLSFGGHGPEGAVTVDYGGIGPEADDAGQVDHPLGPMTRCTVHGRSATDG